jgi:hypothetical protein
VKGKFDYGFALHHTFRNPEKVQTETGEPPPQMTYHAALRCFSYDDSLLKILIFGTSAQKKVRVVPPHMR